MHALFQRVQTGIREPASTETCRVSVPIKVYPNPTENPVCGQLGEMQA